MEADEQESPMSRRPDSAEITRLLRAWHDGDPREQEELWTILYDELRILARSVRRRHGGNPARGLRTTTLVHEAFLRLLGTDIAWVDRRHFYGVAARAMRFVLVDAARRRLSRKRGGGERIGGEISEEVVDPTAHRPEELLAVHEALARLHRINPRQEKLVELRYFAGLSLEETAEILGVSTPTAKRDWKAARLWLYGELRARKPLGESGETPS